MVDEFDMTVADIKAVIISSVMMFILSLGSIGIMVSTFSEFKDYMIWSRFAVVAFLFSVGASLIWGFRRKLPTLITGLALFLLPVLIILGSKGLSNGVFYVIEVLKVRALVFLHMPGNIGPSGSSHITDIFLLYSAVAIMVGALVYLKRLPSVLAMILYVIPPLITIQINDLFPQPAYCVLFIFGMIFLVFAGQIRKADKIKAQDRLIKLAGIAFLMAFIPSFLYPMDTYDKYEIANKQYEYFEKKLSGKFEEIFPSFNKQWHYKGSAILENGALQGFDTRHEYLNTVGYFDPKPIPVFEVDRRRNPEYDGVLSSTSTEYIKLGVLDIYQNNQWTCDDDAFNYLKLKSMVIGIDEGPKTSQFITKIEQHAFIKPELDVTYSELYEGATEEDEYASNVIPVMKMDDSIYWEPNYIRDVVNDSDLYVPDSTREAILATGVLPDWYLDLYYGRTEMSDIEKVQKITNYVAGLHVYRRDTPYQPEDQDFVAYFIKEAKSGFCVHFNTTTAILLRMVGVPTRYVTGYMATGLKYGQTSTVTLENAHAWFEFFDSDFGWVLGDATPGNRISARDYDINGILSQYYLNEFKAEPTPRQMGTDSNMPTNKPFSELGKPTGGNDEEDSSLFGLPELFSLTPVKIVLILIGAFVGSWVIYAVWTFISLNFGHPNKRARAYYRLYRRVFLVLDVKAPKIAVQTGEKAAFSKDGITAEELNEMIQTTNKYIRECAPSRSRIKRIIVRLLMT